MDTSTPPLPLPVFAVREEPAANCRLRNRRDDSCARELPPGLLAKIERHPCYSEEAHHHFARMHLPVAPRCNLQCHYCNRRYDCANESRPGVTSERLTPDQAVARVLAVAAEMPQLAVVGIAGPGDPLANPGATFETLERVRAVAPDLVFCLSTNGLALPDFVDRIVGLGVGHVTVTVNMIDPEVGERIYPWAVWRGRKVVGRDASRLLSERQLEGIARLAERGVLCKVNSVVIPGVNDAHLPEVSRRVTALGAFVHNLIPLLSRPAYGSHYGRTGLRGPTHAELDALRARCSRTAHVMRHCRQCRADAIGLLGDDRNADYTQERPPASPPRDGSASRSAYRSAVTASRLRVAGERELVLERLSDLAPSRPARVAVATRGGGFVNEHFGHAREFLVYDVTRDGARLVDIRRADRFCKGGEGEDDLLDAILTALSDCRAVLVARIGACPRERLVNAGIEPVTDLAFEPVEVAALEWFLRSYASEGDGPLGAGWENAVRVAGGQG